MTSGGVYFSTEQRLQWHPTVHEDLGQETLHYWFLTLSTSYEWSELRAELVELLAEHHVYSFALYELMGDCDVLLRVWLPRGTSGSFRVSLQKRFHHRFSLSEEVLYTVERVIRHWPFAEEGRGEIFKIEGEAAQPDTGLVEMANDRLLQGFGCDDPILQPLASQGTIGPQNHRTDQVPGVKIVTLIKPIREMDFERKEAVGKQLALKLDQQQKIVQRSLYQVDGFRAAFLLTCLVPKSDFFTFRDELVGELAPILSAAGARTNSYACASPDLLMFQDFIPPANVRRKSVKPRIRRVKDLLELEESTTLEVKGSALAPLDPWLHEGKELSESIHFFYKGVLKTVVGLLNTDGGSILIGALEPGRTGRDRRDWMAENAPEIKDMGKYSCLGLLDPIYRKKGWDAYERKLAELIASNVRPDPSPFVEIHVEEVEGLMFAVVDVGSGHEADDWHYVEPRTGNDRSPQFWVRQGARTIRLDGIEADRYKRLRG